MLKAISRYPMRMTVNLTVNLTVKLLIMKKSSMRDNGLQVSFTIEWE